MTDHIDNPRFRGLVIRKNADDLSDWIDRADRMYVSLGAKKTGKPAIFKFPSGAQIKTGHLKDESAYTKYQGHEYQRMLIEELNQIPDERRYIMLLGSCRSTVDQIDSQIFCTTNPGGVGHVWVKKRFVDVAPPNTVYWYQMETSDGQKLRKSRIFIPAKMEDNPILMTKDPGYVATIEMIKDTDPELYKAWRNGDWNVFAGQFFKEFNPAIHVIKPFRPKDSLWHIGGLDWGRNDPFSFHAAVVIPVSWTNTKTGMHYRFYRVVTYAEIYGGDRSPREQSTRIKQAGVNLDLLKRISADNQIFNQGLDNSISIADQFYEEDPRWHGVLKAASKDRIPGWENIHNWLSIAPDGLPYWLITSNCHHLIESLPALVHDERIVEDISHESTLDHAPDDQRYMLKDLKWVDARVSVVHYNGQQLQVPQLKRAVMEIDVDAFASSSKSKVVSIG